MYYELISRYYELASRHYELVSRYLENLFFPVCFRKCPFRLSFFVSIVRSLMDCNHASLLGFYRDTTFELPTWLFFQKTRY